MTDRVRPNAPRPRAPTREPAQEGDRYSLVDGDRIRSRHYERTIPGMPVPIVPAPRPPPRSLSPVPWDPVSQRGKPAETPLPSTPPDGARVKVGSVDVRVGGVTLRKFIPWAAPFVLSVLGTVGGWVYGYGRGMLDAAAEVAAVRESVKQNGLTDTQRHEQTEGDLNRVFLLVRQAQKDIKSLQEEAGELKDSTPRIQGIAPPK